MAAQMHDDHDSTAKRFDLQAEATQSKDQAVATPRNAADASAHLASTAAYTAVAVLLPEGIARDRCAAENVHGRIRQPAIVTQHTV